MRTNDVLLKGFSNIKTLQQFLYMSEDHYIDIRNAINVPLRIRMDDDGNYLSKNMNYPDIAEMNFTERMNVSNMISMIEQLKEQPAVEYPKNFNSRWEEIEFITFTNVTQNELKQPNVNR